MKNRLIFRSARGKFTSAKKARYVYSNGKKFEIHPKARVKERKRIIERARKSLGRKTFADKIAEQLPLPPGTPNRSRWREEEKTLNVPGKKNATFNVKKYYFEVEPPYLVSVNNVTDQINSLMSKFWPKVKKVFIPGKNYLFRIDTAYRDKDGYARVDADLKAGKDGLSDGRGYSIGRYLEIDTLQKLKKYLQHSIYGFLKSFETYIGRKGIISGQINALTLEIS